MEKLKAVVPYKATSTAIPAQMPTPKPATLSAKESKELSIVNRSLRKKGPQTLPSGKFKTKQSETQSIPHLSTALDKQCEHNLLMICLQARNKM